MPHPLLEGSVTGLESDKNEGLSDQCGPLCRCVDQKLRVDRCTRATDEGKQKYYVRMRHVGLGKINEVGQLFWRGGRRERGRREKWERDFGETPGSE